MIEIFGSSSTSEYYAATRLKELIAEEWPDVAESTKDRVCLIPAVKCFGQSVQDVDILVIGRLRKPRALPKLPWMNHEKFLLSFVLAIEVKAHREESVTFEGNKVFVRYSGGLRKDATEQSFKQRFSVLEYLKKNLSRKPPMVLNLIWLTSFPHSKVPRAVTHNVLGNGARWVDFLTTIAGLEQEWLSKPGINLVQAFPQANQDQLLNEVIDVFTKRVESTPLDRMKVERITKRILDDQIYSKKLGEQLLIFRGRGGTGKTIRLIRLAYEIFEDRSARTLLLTYNLSLVSDIKRTLSIIGVPADSDGPVMRVVSVQKFMLDLMVDAGIIPRITDDALGRYDVLLQELAQLIAAFEDGDEPDYDFVLIDEAQDWPEAERDIVFKLFGPRRCIVADGIDQLVRSDRSTDWTARLKGAPNQVVALRQSLRLKANLTEFVNAFAEEMDVPGWRLQVNTEISGGRVTVVVGSLSSALSNLDDVFAELHKGINRPIDSLICVPFTSATSNDTRTIIDCLNKRNIGCWDGTDRAVRSSFPKTVGEARLVTYESCRGLEGWSVICLSIDQFFDSKIKHYVDSRPEDLYTTPEEVARRLAAAWTMIPLTRAMDHLVVHIQQPDHLLAQTADRLQIRFGGSEGWLRVMRIGDD